jgi:CshA-type fibril repeat protein
MGQLLFNPAFGFSGTAPSVTYQITNSIAQTASNTYTATVTKPSPPVATNQASTGNFGAFQNRFLDFNTVTLVDAQGDPSGPITLADKGTYSVQSGDGVQLTFHSTGCDAGVMPAVTYRVTDAYGQTDDALYTATVTRPAGPAAGTLATTGIGTHQQTATPVLPTCGGTVKLLTAGGTPTTSVVRTEGTYTVVPASGVITFAPQPGFLGTPTTPLAYRLTDSYAQSDDSTYAVTVTEPAPPTAPAVTSTGPADTKQSKHVTVPSGGSVRLLDTVGHVTKKVVVSGQGTYATTAGVITFTPLAGFVGLADATRYQLADSYGQTAISTYRATVTKALVQPGFAHLKAPRLVKSATSVPATCSLSVGRVAECSVTAYATVNGHWVKAGTGSVTVQAAKGRTTLTVPVTLNRTGRQLAARTHGVKLTLTATLDQVSITKLHHARTSTRAVAPTVRLRPIYFSSGSAVVGSADRAYLLSLRPLLADVRSISCTGFTDSRSTIGSNVDLAKRRAQNVCAILTSGLGINLTTLSRGELKPSHSNATASGRALNRRAQITLHY